MRLSILSKRNVKLIFIVDKSNILLIQRTNSKILKCTEWDIHAKKDNTISRIFQILIVEEGIGHIYCVIIHTFSIWKKQNSFDCQNYVRVTRIQL